MSTVDYLNLTERNGTWGRLPTRYFGQTFVATATNLSASEFTYDLVSLRERSPASRSCSRSTPNTP
jgi:hypothetical protein